MYRITVLGNSHITSLRGGWRLIEADYPDFHLEFINLGKHRIVLPKQPTTDSDLIVGIAPVREDLAKQLEGSDHVLLLLRGNEHNLLGLFEIFDDRRTETSLSNGVRKGLNEWLDTLEPVLPCPATLIVPPPPIESEQHLRAHPGPFSEHLETYRLRDAGRRLALWQTQKKVTLEVAKSRGIYTFEPTGELLSSTGFLPPEVLGRDPTHANALYGKRLLKSLLPSLASSAPMTKAGTPHPYSKLPAHAYWKQSVAQPDAGEVDPVVSPRWTISPEDKVATAGSCFAQHISKHLRDGGYGFMVTEVPDLPVDEALGRGFYDFSARYGNVYTARQLLQMFDRAFGDFKPAESVWEREDGRLCDPFRPRVEADGYVDVEALESDRGSHLAAVRQMFLELDVFVFTLGLTECWVSKQDGAAFPIAPGVAGGCFDDQRHAFVNFGVNDVSGDLDAFISRLGKVNPTARVLLTVSPVPLIATREARHVLASTTWSKSVLRVCAQEMVDRYPHVEYFPSYEIITGPHARGRYYAEDLRSVTQRGVNHVMRVFMARMTSNGGTQSRSEQATETDGDDDSRNRAISNIEAAAEAACDEELYSR